MCRRVGGCVGENLPRILNSRFNAHIVLRVLQSGGVVHGSNVLHVPPDFLVERCSQQTNSFSRSFAVVKAASRATTSLHFTHDKGNGKWKQKHTHKLRQTHLQERFSAPHCKERTSGPHSSGGTAAAERLPKQRSLPFKPPRFCSADFAAQASCGTEQMPVPLTEGRRVTYCSPI